MVEVTRDDDHSRYELREDGRVVAIADYHLRGDRQIFFHTEVEEAQRGRGLGAILVRAALDDARANGRRVVPTCSFVRQFVAENPEYDDIVAH